MKQSTALVGALLAVLAASAEAQKTAASVQRNAPVKRAAPPHSAAALPPAPLVGGSDSCATPDAIAGTGSFAYDNSAATTATEGQTEALCNIFGFTVIENDVWFTWTAPSSGTAVFATCGSPEDTKIAAYAGSACPTAGTALACSDDDCAFALQSRVLFPVTSGNSYVLQLGNFIGSAPGNGQFNLSVSVPPSNDDCSTPLTVVGVDTRHAFDNVLATTGTQGQAQGSCNIFGNTAINGDVWYTWVAPSSGTFAVVTEGLTDVDTKIAVYLGMGCPSGSAIGCNDDGGVVDAQTITTFAAASGSSYTIQLGLNPFTTTGGTGKFAIISTTPRAEDNCATPAAISGQGLMPFDNVFSSAGPQAQTEALCNLVFAGPAVDSDSWYLWTPDATGTATITSCPGTYMDTKIGVYPGSTCPTANSAIDCDDDACGPTTFQSQVVFPVSCGQTYLIQVGSYPYGGQDGGLGDLDVSIVGSPCSTPSTPFCTGDAVGTTCVPCSNNGAAGRGCANSSFAAGALLTNTGVASVSTDTLVLACTDLPGPGLFFQANAVNAPTSFGDGMLCASVGIIRMGVVFPTGNSASYPGGLTPAPISTAGAPVHPGDVKHYQCWYRDADASFCPTATFNTSNGITLTWSN